MRYESMKHLLCTQTDLHIYLLDGSDAHSCAHQELCSTFLLLSDVA